MISGNMEGPGNPQNTGQGQDQSSGSGFSKDARPKYNLMDLKKEEEVLRTIHAKMTEQLHKLEVEELELKQRIRKKDMRHTDALLLTDANAHTGRSSAVMADMPQCDYKAANNAPFTHQYLDSINQVSGVPVASSDSQPSTSKTFAELKVVGGLDLPNEDSFKPEALNLNVDLSILNTLSLPMEATDFVESEDESD